MHVENHATAKYSTGRRVARTGTWNAVCAEIWRHESGHLTDLTLSATEVAVLLEGRSRVRRTGNNRTQESYGVPGTFWLCPAGTFESNIRIDGTFEKCLHIFLPPSLIGLEALSTFGLDPDSVRLDYVGGRQDPRLTSIAAQFCSVLYSDENPAQRLLIEGLRTTLAAHLLGHYLANGSVPARRTKNEGGLDTKRLKRVLDSIEERISEDLSLLDLANEACLSPCHFLRRFQRSIGMSPHRYVITRRVERAKDLLKRGDRSLTEVALDLGFGSQSNFCRVFKSETGQTPGDFRLQPS